MYPWRDGSRAENASWGEVRRASRTVTHSPGRSLIVPGRSRSRRDREHDLSNHLATFEHAMRVGGVGERERCMNDRRYAAGFDSGQTSGSSSAAIRPFSSRVRARSVDAVIVSLFVSNVRKEICA